VLVVHVSVLVLYVHLYHRLEARKDEYLISALLQMGYHDKLTGMWMTCYRESVVRMAIHCYCVLDEML